MYIYVYIYVHVNTSIYFYTFASPPSPTPTPTPPPPQKLSRFPSHNLYRQHTYGCPHFTACLRLYLNDKMSIKVPRCRCTYLSFLHKTRM